MATTTTDTTRTKSQHDIRFFDYKDVEVLKQYMSPHGRIMSRRRTSLTGKQQRALEQAVKRARFMGLLPYIQK